MNKNDILCKTFDLRNNKFAPLNYLRPLLCIKRSKTYRPLFFIAILRNTTNFIQYVITESV